MNFNYKSDIKKNHANCTTVCCRGKRGHKGDTGPQGPVGPAGTTLALAYGYAVGDDTSTINTNTDVIFNLGTILSTGFAQTPSISTTAFKIATTGIYEFDFYVVGKQLTSYNSLPLQFALYVNNSPVADAYNFRSNCSLSTEETRVCIGHGIISLQTNDLVTLRNITGNLTDIAVIKASATTGTSPISGPDGPNRTLTLKQLV